MRFGWLAAAAAMVLGAGQAEAARYYTFEVTGSARVTDYDPFGIAPPTTYDRLSRFTASFDTQSSPSPDGYLSFGVPEVVTAFSTFVPSIRTINSPGGTYFNLSFSLASIATSDMLQLIPTSGSYGYRNCDNRYRVCTDVPGTLFSLAARTSDTAPAVLGETESLQITAVPEPASWILMILGMGLVGWALRRTKATHRDRPNALSDCVV